MSNEQPATAHRSQAVSPPRPRSARELAARIAAERAGHPFLLYRDANDVQQIVILDGSRERLSIGREALNDLVIAGDPEVSRVHAELVAVAGHWTVNDDGLSRNGSFVNGQLVPGRVRLRDGDCLRVGQTLIAFAAPAAGEQAGATAVAAHSPLPVGDLTATQRRILVALCRPMVDGGTSPATNKRIADEVNLSVEGVKGQLRTLSDRFGIGELPQNSKRLELAVRALQSGLGVG